MSPASFDPYSVYPSREKGIGTRRIIEMVGVLHRLGYGRLRLACSWENAGPAPVWFGAIAAVGYFRRDHGALLARNPLPENNDLARRNRNPNDAPMFTSRRFSRPDYPWPGFLRATPEQLADKWLGLYPQLAVEGRGEDPDYVTWYARMLELTAPTGLIAAACYWEPLPGYMYVSCGPVGVDRIPLPPPGEAPSAEPDLFP
jgi:hypothetical protein